MTNKRDLKALVRERMEKTGESYMQAKRVLTENRPCLKCEQTNHGQSGEYPCSECGLPTLWDECPTGMHPPATVQRPPIACIFCSEKFETLALLKSHSAQCPDHPAVREASRLRRLTGMTARELGELLRRVESHLQRQGKLDEARQYLRGFEGEVPAEFAEWAEIARAEALASDREARELLEEQRRRKPLTDTDFVAAQVAEVQKHEKALPTRFNNAIGPQPADLRNRADLTEEEKKNLAEAEAREVACTCGRFEPCLFHHPPVVTEPIVLPVAPVVAKGGLSETGTVDVARRVFDRLKTQREREEAMRAESSVVRVDIGNLSPDEAVQIVSGGGLQRETVERWLGRDTDGRPRCCELYGEPVPSSVNDEAWVHPRTPTGRLVCRVKGSASKDRRFPYFKAPDLTGYERKSCGHVGEVAHCPVCREASREFFDADTNTWRKPLAVSTRTTGTAAQKAVSALPEFPEGLCECCGRMPHACACGTPGHEVSRAQCTKCLKPYWLQASMGRQCQRCGATPVEVVSLFRIVVNGKVLDTTEETLTYANVLKLAGYDPERVISVTHRWKGSTGALAGMERSGTLSPGRTVETMDGMVINAMDTSNA